MNKKARKLIKRGSVWKKRDQGVIYQVVAICKGDTAKVRKLTHTKGVTHSIKFHDLLKFYDKIKCNVMDFLKILFTPSIWVQNHEYSEVWDTRLNAYMEKYKFTEVSKYTAKLGPLTIWISNHPYASFTCYEPKLEVRPSRATILKAHAKLVSDCVRDIEKEVEESLNSVER